MNQTLNQTIKPFPKGRIYHPSGNDLFAFLVYEKAKCTYFDIAMYFGRSTSTVSKWGNPKHSDCITYRDLSEIAEMLGFNLVEVLAELQELGPNYPIYRPSKKEMALERPRGHKAKLLKELDRFR